MRPISDREISMDLLRKLLVIDIGWRISSFNGTHGICLDFILPAIMGKRGVEINTLTFRGWHWRVKL